MTDRQTFGFGIAQSRGEVTDTLGASDTVFVIAVLLLVILTSFSRLLPEAILMILKL